MNNIKLPDSLGLTISKFILTCYKAVKKKCEY